MGIEAAARLDQEESREQAAHSLLRVRVELPAEELL